MFTRVTFLVPYRAQLPRLVRALHTSHKDGRVLTIQETREKLKTLMGSQQLWGLKAPASPPSQIKPAVSQDELPVRRMGDSYREAIIPLGTSARLRERYLNFYRGIRTGKILEDLDTFAVAIGYTHTLYPEQGDQKPPMSIVTALVDRIELYREKIVPDKDIKMTGKVTWAGRTSLETTMDLHQEIEENWRKILTARFVLVSRSPSTGGSVVINKLEPVGHEEEDLFQQGEANKLKRIKDSQRTLLKTPPDEEERLLIHELFLKTIDASAHSFKVRVKPENSVWMDETILKNVVICMPEQRNLYNKIFGGYLMRKAFELAWANAALYCKQRPYIDVVDDIVFRKPVEIGSLLFLSSQIVYTADTRLEVRVHAEVVNCQDDTRETTNDFHFSFSTRDSSVLPSVFPKTYAEAMLYLNGKRHFDS